MGKNENRGETEKGENMEWSTVGWGHMTGMGQFRQVEGNLLSVLGREES